MQLAVARHLDDVDPCHPVAWLPLLDRRGDRGKERHDVAGRDVPADEVRHEYGVEMTGEPDRGAYDVVVLTVAHRQFRDLGVNGIRAFGKPGALLYDVKYLLPADASDDRL